MTNPILVEVTRGGRVESLHRGSVAISDAAGNLRLALGDIQTPVFPRSALKPIQALPLLESGAVLSEEDIALACASHSGEPQHTIRVAAWQARLGVTVEDLACGRQRPTNVSTADAMIARGEAWTPLHNNCSGKHTGFMNFALQSGVPVAGYERPDHPVQQAVEKALLEMTGLEGPLPHGIDGCAVPAFAVPLAAMAKAMARFADPSQLPPGLPSGRAQACQRIVAAMIAHPELVGGTGRADTLLMRQSGAMVVKTGAEGTYIAIIPKLGLGIALKMDDGATRASECLIAALLISLGVLPDEGAAHDLAHAPVTNTRRAVVGECHTSDVIPPLL